MAEAQLNRDCQGAVHLIDWNFFFDFYTNPYWKTIVEGVRDTKGFLKASQSLRKDTSYSFGKLISFLIFSSDSAAKKNVSKKIVWQEFAKYTAQCLREIREANRLLRREGCGSSEVEAVRFAYNTGSDTDASTDITIPDPTSVSTTSTA